jgi:hexosaminidase
VFQLTSRTVIAAPADDASALMSARYLADLLARTRGPEAQVVQGDAPAGATCRGAAPRPAGGEAYVLDAKPDGLVIQAHGDAGLFYGAVSAWQLATATPGKGPADIAAIHVEDGRASLGAA